MLFNFLNQSIATLLRLTMKSFSGCWFYLSFIQYYCICRKSLAGLSSVAIPKAWFQWGKELSIIILLKSSTSPLLKVILKLATCHHFGCSLFLLYWYNFSLSMLVMHESLLVTSSGKGKFFYKFPFWGFTKGRHWENWLDLKQSFNHSRDRLKSISGSRAWKG